MSLARFRLLGRSGLRVSPLCLGTMTFAENWGADEAESRRIFDAYCDAGGNFIDTANMYASGRSESCLGIFAEGRRHGLVISSKYGFAMTQGDPNAGGNHRKSLMRSLEDSLRRLRTDYIDLYYLHVWDGTTSADEIMRALDDAVRAGKILYAGISDTPAWQIARMQTLADLRGFAPLVALQAEYNLIERTAERDLVPAAQALGLGVLPWSPLASGLLSGKYGSAVPPAQSARRDLLAAHGRITGRAIAIADCAAKIARQIGATPAQVAIAWLLANPAITAPVLGARTLAQLKDNLGALNVTLAPEHHAALEDASRIDAGFPHDFLAQPFVRQGVSGGTTISPRGTWA
jgi:aryl-alcohol dehydrogenase-like predicted oxidoreductase